MNLEKIKNDFFSKDLFYTKVSFNFLIRELQLCDRIDNAKILTIACSVVKGDEEVFVTAAKTQLQLELLGGVQNFLTFVSEILSYDPEILEDIKFQTEFFYKSEQKTMVEALGIRNDFKTSYNEFLNRETTKLPKRIPLPEVVELYASYPFMTSEEVIMAGGSLGRLLVKNLNNPLK